MARFISISLMAVVLNNMFALAQKHESFPMCMLVNESELLQHAPSDFAEVPPASPTVNIYSNFNSNYLTLEVVGASKALSFQLVNSKGEEVYSGSISGTQLIETATWPSGTYYFLCGSKSETIYVSR